MSFWALEMYTDSTARSRQLRGNDGIILGKFSAERLRCWNIRKKIISLNQKDAYFLKMTYIY